MSLDDTLNRLQDAAWDYAASLPDAGPLSDSQLAGWVQVARAAAPLLRALERPGLAESLRQSAATAPARPAARAEPDPNLAVMADALREANEQVAAGASAERDVADVVVVVLQSTARTTTVPAAESPNPQLRSMSTTIDAAVLEARETVGDAEARMVPTSRIGPSAPARATEPVPAVQRAHDRRPETPQGPSRSM